MIFGKNTVIYSHCSCNKVLCNSEIPNSIFLHITGVAKTLSFLYFSILTLALHKLWLNERCYWFRIVSLWDPSLWDRTLENITEVLWLKKSYLIRSIVPVILHKTIGMSEQAISELMFELGWDMQAKLWKDECFRIISCDSQASRETTEGFYIRSCRYFSFFD